MVDVRNRKKIKIIAKEKIKNNPAIMISPILFAYLLIFF